jgi:hypothetical protein
MADALTIAAIPVRVLAGTWVEKESIYQGARVRAKAGNLISTETTPKRVYECQVDFYEDAEEAALRAACPRGQGVAIAGELPATAFTGVVDIGQTATSLVIVNGLDTLLRTASLHIEEV